jgi:hypothetical protein
MLTLAFTKATIAIACLTTVLRQRFQDQRKAYGSRYHLSVSETSRHIKRFHLNQQMLTSKQLIIGLPISGNALSTTHINVYLCFTTDT